MNETEFYLSMAALLTFFGVVIAVSSGINEVMMRIKERRERRETGRTERREHTAGAGRKAS